MNSPVLNLQHELTSSNCDLESCLREAHLIAVKLGLQEFDNIVTMELNGYESDNLVPSYRKVKGQLKAFNPYSGWIPSFIEDPDIEKTVTEYNIRNSVSELKALTSKDKGDNGIVIMMSGQQQALLEKWFKTPVPMQFGLHITGAAVIAVLNKIQTAIMDWTLKLEKAQIIGEDFSFNASELAIAKEYNTVLNNYYGPTTIITGTTDTIQVANGNQNIEFSYKQASDLIDEINKSIDSDNLKGENKEKANDLIDSVKTAIDQKKKPNVIKESFITLKDFLLQVGANITADLILAKMNGVL